MKVIIPIQSECNQIISGTYNVPFDADVTTWSNTVTYAKGDKVTKDNCGAVVYESLIATNTGNDPEEVGGTSWLEIGTSNYFAMFDTRSGTQTTKPESIELEINFTGLVNSVSLVNVEGSSVRFEVWDNVNNLVYDKTFSLLEYGSTDWFDYFYGEITKKDQLVKFDIPQVLSGRGKMTLLNTGSIAKLGGLIYGKQFIIGESQWGVSVGITDYSTKETDVFGNFFIVERQYNDRLNVDVVCDLNRVTGIKKTLSQYRATPLLWAASEAYGSTIVFGYYKSFNIELSHAAFADCSLEIEGVS